MSTLISRRHWLRGSRNQNVVLPLKLIDPSSDDTAVSSPTTIGSPSSVKLLFPSISMFNLPIQTIPETTPLLSPPPQFAVDNKRNKFRVFLKPRKRGIRKAYPSAFETFLFDDALPGSPTQGIQPVRLLIERLEAWYLLAKRLLHHFEVLASVETRVAKNYRKLDRVMIFPSPATKRYNHRVKGGKRSLNKRKRRRFYKDERLLQLHFAFQGGVRGVCDAWQDYHSNTTKDHAEFATFLRNEAIPTLANIKRELKWMIKSIRSDDRLSLSTLTTLKREAADRLKQLDRQLVFFDEHPYHGHSKTDPWLMNAAVVKQMVKVYRQENKIHETVLRLQRETLISEEQLVEEFRRLCQHIYSMRETSTLGTDRGLESIMETFNNIKMDSDWLHFCQQHNDHLVSETAAFRHPDHLQYPNHSHALLQPIFAARMERKSLILHHWHEYIYVLTPAGFLHEYRNGKDYPSKPDATIFVPHYKVSSLSTNLHHNLIFQLQPHSASRNLLKNQGCPTVLPKEWRTTKPRLGCVDRFTWTLRAKSAADMESWIQHLTDSSERYRPSVVNHFIPPIQPDIVISPAAEEEAPPPEEPVAEPEIEDPTPEPEPAVEPAVEPEVVEPEAEPEAEPAAEPVADPEPEAAADPEPEAVVEAAVVEAVVEPADEPVAEAEATPEPVAEEPPVDTLVIE
ncbi:uncharacterized protein EV154DRAFT_605573 [Mucor mucedo]|uniref:uncharacterized protein n=1 Tax=Mucor mucedo TaxID=29922 RepID=UPI002220980E|nr:uncharacterized protein EV154DRAFT_605573 [Mucor mucedo]KAI7886848.1 hypothetical protein EV154DRAFT_605573 [Mucor mucedo]